MSLLLTGAGVSGGSWTPAALTSLRLWLTAGPQWCFTDAGATTPCGDGDPVYTWVDQSGTGNFIQAIEADRPILRLDAGGKWYAEPDGIDDFIGRAGSLTGSHSLFAAIRPTWGVNNTVLWNGDGSNFGALFGNSTDGFIVAATAGDVVPFPGVPLDGEDQSVGYTYDGTTCRTYRDGTAGATGAWGAGVASGVLRLGANASGGQKFTGRVYAVVAPESVPSTGERTSLFSYFAGLMPA